MCSSDLNISSLRPRPEAEDIRIAPIMYIDNESRLMTVVITGIMTDITRLVNRFVEVSSSLAFSNFASWYSSALYARTTLTPVRPSSVMRLTLSVSRCIILKRGTTRYSTMVIVIIRAATAAAVASVQCISLSAIFTIAHTAIRGAFMTICIPMAKAICT